ELVNSCRVLGNLPCFADFFRRLRRAGQYYLIMLNDRSRILMDHLRGLAEAARSRDTSDQELVQAFATGKDDGAFDVLVRRHGPMVLSLCRRLLGNEHDAEDAYQATFLVLARKARSLRRRELVANWLYGVARRTAQKARVARSRRAGHEA